MRPPATTAAALIAIGTVAERSSPGIVVLGPAGGMTRVLHEAVAHAPHVEDEPRPTTLLLQLAPQPAGVRVERARAAERFEAPDVAKQLLLREDASRLGCERPQQRELLVGELDAAFPDADLAGDRVDDQVADPQRPALRPDAPAHHRSDQGEQLRVVERLHEVAVGALREAAHPIGVARP